MALPTHEDLMLLLLRLLADGATFSYAALCPRLYSGFSLTDPDLSRATSDGRSLLKNKLEWVKGDSVQAGLVEGLGRFSITPLGIEVLATNQARIDRTYRKRFPRFRDYLARRKKRAT